MGERIYIFKGFERFWHWSQAALVMFMLLTGFEIHGSYALFGFAKAVAYHGIAAWSLIGLWIFAIFWHLTTGEWRHYIPTTEKVLVVAKYYSYGIFKHEPHPFKPSSLNKHNPLQRLTYLGVLLFISPLLWISGGLYLHLVDIENASDAYGRIREFINSQFVLDLKLCDLDPDLTYRVLELTMTERLMALSAAGAIVASKYGPGPAEMVLTPPQLPEDIRGLLADYAG